MAFFSDHRIGISLDPPVGTGWKQLGTSLLSEGVPPKSWCISRCFPKVGVPPKWMVKTMENPIKKGMIWGENPLFLETSISRCFFWEAERLRRIWE